MDLKFTAWEKFVQRKNLDQDGTLNKPGIYALAISNETLKEEASNYPKQIVYFGMTNSRTGLQGRLNAFDNSICGRRGRPGHGGAERFRGDYPCIDKVKELLSTLYVAVMPFECDVRSISKKDLLVMGDVLKAEFIAFAMYAGKYKQLPKYNDKSNKKLPLKKIYEINTEDIDFFIKNNFPQPASVIF